MTTRTEPSRGPRRTLGVARVTALVVATGAVLVTAALVATPGAPAADPSPAAAPVGDETCDGVVVVVDPGGDIGPSVMCAPGDPSDGMVALRDAGHDLDTLTRDPRFVCRIDGHPANDPCTRFAPSDAYWSSWRLEDSRWVYATVGAADTDPAPGDVEGWAFGGGTPPRVDPVDLARAPLRPTGTRP